MNDVIREEWRKWHENEIIALSKCVHRDARMVDHCCFGYGEPSGVKIKTIDQLVEDTKNYGNPIPDDLYWLTTEEMYTLALSISRRREYFDRCREIAENCLWQRMQANVCTEAVELPDDLLGAL